MMTLQARDMRAPMTDASGGLRAYPTDSPRAKARLVVLALLADGRIDAAELESLNRRDAFATLGLSREVFFQVLYDFCADLVELPSGSGSYLVSPAVLESLFAEICDPAERRELLRLIFDVIRSDGHLAEGEARLFWNALDAWKLRLNDGAEVRPREPATKPQARPRAWRKAS